MYRPNWRSSASGTVSSTNMYTYSGYVRAVLDKFGLRYCQQYNMYEYIVYLCMGRTGEEVRPQVLLAVPVPTNMYSA